MTIANGLVSVLSVVALIVAHAMAQAPVGRAAARAADPREGENASGDRDHGDDVERGYAPVNGLMMYYEIWGQASGGDASAQPPLVLLHGGGSTIQTSFSEVIGRFARTRRVIGVEQQGHGHTADVERPFTFEQSADDTAALLQYLKVAKADFFGYSNGGSIALQMGIRHPGLTRKLVVMSAMYKRDGLVPGLLESLETATPEGMPAELREAYLKVAPHPEQLATFVSKCARRMVEFKDWSPEVIRSIGAPTLVMIGDSDIVTPEHAVEMYRLLPHGQLAVLPATDHMTIVKRPDWEVSMVEAFLDAPMPEVK